MIQRVLVGGTASGKKAVAVELSRRHGLPLLSMDSMKVYRGMDIGTDKPDAALRARAPFALLDLIGHDGSFSVGAWARAAREEIDRVGGEVLFAGGTPLYLRALLLGLCDAPPADPSLRAELEASWTGDGEAVVRARLEALDPESAQRLSPGDSKRVLRALEVAVLTGRPLSVWQKDHTEKVVDGRFVVAALSRTPEDAFARQSARAAAMFDRGLVAEVDDLRQQAPFGREAGRAIGYAEVLAWRAGLLPQDRILSTVITRTRQLQRKQRMFLSSLPGISWVNVRPDAAFHDVVADVERALEL